MSEHRRHRSTPSNLERGRPPVAPVTIRRVPPETLRPDGWESREAPTRYRFKRREDEHERGY